MQGNFLLNIFPPPRYLLMPSVGLDISDRSVKYIELLRNRGNIALGRFGEYAIPDGAIEGGIIKDNKIVREVLTTLRKDLSVHFISASLPEEKAYIVPMTVPVAGGQNLREAIELQIEDRVPLAAEDIVFDYARPKNQTVVQKTPTPVSVSAVPRDIVSSYSDTFSASGLTPLSFEVEAYAIARALLPKNDPGTYMIVDFGRTRTGFIIVGGGTVWFSSTVAIGGDAITEAIKKKSGLPVAAARNLKENEGLSRAPSNKELFFTLTPVISVLKDEVSKHYLYWNTHRDEHSLPGGPVEKIIMCGGDANIPGLLEYLSAGLDVPVTFGNAWSNIIASFDETIPAITFNNSLRFATAIGLALRGFIST